MTDIPIESERDNRIQGAEQHSPQSADAQVPEKQSCKRAVKGNCQQPENVNRQERIPNGK